MVSNDSYENANGRTGEAVSQLASWIIRNYAYTQREPLTHLKLQKLFFYCYGALLAGDLESEVGPEIIFEPWAHGPVNRALYDMFKVKGAKPITADDCGHSPIYSSAVSQVLCDASIVYGAMSAWSLREQTHLEEPWHSAYSRRNRLIDSSRLKAFFKTKFASGSVSAPEYLFGLGSFKIDGIPVQTYRNLHDLAATVQRVFSAKS